MQYSDEHFTLLPSGKPKWTICNYVMNALAEYGVPANENSIRKVEDFTLYPVDYFNPIDDYTGIVRRTPNTRSIHWFRKSWMPHQTPARIFISRWAHRLIGFRLSALARKILQIK